MRLSYGPLFLLVLSLVFLSCSDDIAPPSYYFPGCEIVSPDNDASFTFGDSVIVRVSAWDSNGEVAFVEFYVNGRFEAVDDTPPFVYILSNLAYRIGRHSIVAVAINDAGFRSSDAAEMTISSDRTPVYDVVVKNTYAHDPGAFTQGLVFDGGYLYEGTGLWGQSSIRKVELETGTVVNRRDIPNEYFGEGIAIWEDKIYQLTWRSGTGFVYGKTTFDSLSSFSYDTEGWGLTNDDERLIMSDGSSKVYFRDPDTFDVTGQIQVADAGEPVNDLNELEYIAGDLFANVWREDRIARISPKTGAVVGWIDLSHICESHRGVLNGIAYDRAGGRLFITGKNWDTLYEIELTF